MLWWKRPKALQVVLERLDDLERRFKLLVLDWDEVYAKMRRAESRLAKSRAILESREEEQQPGAGAASSAIQNGPGLTPHQREVQQMVLRRRAGMS